MQDPDKQHSRAGRARRRANDPPRNDSEEQEPKPDPFVAKLLEHAEASAGLATQVGFLGDSPRGHEYWRIYLTPQLDEYVDVHKTDVAGIRPIPNDTSPLRRVAVWMLSDADVYYTRVDSRRLQASFLQGEIVRAHAPQPGEGEPLPEGGLPGATGNVQCSTASQKCWPWW